MLKIYKGLKIALFILFIALLLITLFFENTRDRFADPASEKNKNVLKGLYESVRSVVLFDPYDNNVLSKVRVDRNALVEIFQQTADSTSNLISDPDFYNNVFIFIVSRKSDDLGALVDSKMKIIPSFKDLVILDRDGTILYKHGGASFIPENFIASGGSDIRIADNNFAVSEKYLDKTLDSEIQITALFDLDIISGELGKFNYPALFIIGQYAVTNLLNNPNLLNLIKNDPKNERTYYTGFSVVETFRIAVGNKYIGTLGVRYPSRGIGSILLILLKVAFLVLLMIGLIALDGSVGNMLESEHQEKMKNRSRYILPKKTEGKKSEQEESVTDANLDWIGDYVKDSETRKKGEKK